MSEEKLQQYCNQLMGLSDPDILSQSLLEVFGKGANIGFNEIDQMQTLIEDSYSQL